jgi:uncharacterized protein (TIGR03086 family)
MAVGRDPIALLARALGQVGAILSRVRPEQASLPTPCSAWDVRALVDHVIRDVQRFTVVTSGRASEQHDRCVIGDDWDAAYRQAARSLLAAWLREDELDQRVQFPFGEFPVGWRLGQQIAYLAMHSWDIAKATGQSTNLDPEVGELALEWARENLKPQFRGEEGSGCAFSAEVLVDNDASLYDRLAGFMGRNPK